jgi:hypothetical protein
MALVLRNIITIPAKATHAPRTNQERYLPHFRFVLAITLPAIKPKTKSTAREYRRLTMLERVRMFIDDVNDIRRVRKAREDYVREEGERMGYDKAGAEYQGQISAKDEQIRQLEAEVRRLRGE